MQTTINKQSYHFTPQADDSALKIIRLEAGLTGAKLSCGAGVCGACTVLVDGVPMTACLLPAHALEGRTVQTVEAYGPDNLHPVQRAFMANDALQCGFCTPGFIVEAIAFYERWREARGTETPSRAEVAEAMAGHLCRCGAYVGIYAAIQEACAGLFDSVTALISPRVEALPKVTGQAKYTVDIQYPGQLVGKILRSLYANATVVNIDTAPARKIEGVKAVVTLLEPDKHLRYVGQEIAAVAAINEQVARQALSAIKIEYNIHPAVIGMKNALAPSAPEVYPGKRKQAANANEGAPLPGKWQRNVYQPRLNLAASKAGKAKKALEALQQNQTGNLVANTWRTEAQIHTALEPHASVAKWEGIDSLTIHVSTQSCHKTAEDVAEYFDLNMEQVQVLCQHVGGGFGAKVGLSTETIAAVSLARQANSPVAVIYDRLEEMTIGGYRPLAEMELALTADESGQLSGINAAVNSDSGIGVGSMITFNMAAMYSKAPRNMSDNSVVTNMPPGRPFRGPGGPLACWSLEQAVDDMAHKLNLSPTALRRKWDTHPERLKLYDWADSLPAWQERPPVASQSGRYKQGIGLAAANWPYLYHPDTHIKVSASPAGLMAETAAQDMGNGTRTVIARAVAEIFGLSPLDITVKLGNSQTVRGPASGGSRTSPSVYAPAQQAAQDLQNKLLQQASAHFNWQNAQLSTAGIRHSEGAMAWPEILTAIPGATATARRGTDARLDFRAMLPLGADDLAMGKGNAGAVYLSEVEVDTLLGRIRVLRAWGGLAVGKIFVPELARSQCYGGIIQGIGYALYEERQIDPSTGTVMSLGLEDYRIPGLGDTPEIEIHFLEEGFDHAKGAGVGLAELATLPVAASIGNAVFHATGWRPTHLPLRPDKVVAGVNGD